MLCSSFIDAFQPKDDSLCQFQKFQMWKLCGDLENKVKVKIMAVIYLVIMHLQNKYEVCTLNGYWFMGICLSHWL